MVYTTIQKFWVSYKKKKKKTQTTTTTTNTFLAAHLDSPLSFNKLLKKFTCIQINILKKFRKFLNPKPILIEGFRSKCIKDTHNLYSNSWLLVYRRKKKIIIIIQNVSDSILNWTDLILYPNVYHYVWNYKVFWWHSKSTKTESLSSPSPLLRRQTPQSLHPQRYEDISLGCSS